MFISKKHLDRRTFLRGVGVTLALPLLDSMVPAQTALAKTAAAGNLRLGFLFIPHGAVMAKWTPIGEGRDMKLSPTLSSLERVKDQVVVLTNLDQHVADPIAGDGGGDHGRGPATFITGTRPKRTEGEDVRAGISLDQILAQKIGQQTPLPSLELATEDTTGLVGACDAGFSCTYINTLSWRTPTTPNPMEINPRVVFEHMFGEGGSSEERIARIQRKNSILDGVTRQINRMQHDLGPSDRSQLNDYLDTIREIERRIQLAEKKTDTQKDLPPTPLGIPEEHEEHSKLMFDLLALAYQADITRVATFMMDRELSQRTFNNIGVPDPFHTTSHHQNDQVKIDKLIKINGYHVGLVARFLEKLKNTPDGDGTLLDHSLFLYGSCMSNSNIHSHEQLPILIAGGANGQLKGGRHVKYPEGTLMGNLLLNIADMANVHLDRMGASTERLTGIS